LIQWLVQKHVLVWLCLNVAILVGGCYRRPQGGEVLARVGNVVLTKEEAMRMIDTSRGDVDTQLRMYTTWWVNNELIYQEAKRHGIENSLEFQQTMSALRRDMLVQEFLQRYLFSDTSKISEARLRQYYQEHEKEFFIREHTLKLNAIGFRTREQANTFASSIIRGLTWDTAAALLRQRLSGGQNIVAEISRQYVSQRTLFSEELWKVALTLSPNEPSYPIRTAQGYFVVQVLSQYPEGTSAEYELVKEEVRERFLVEQSRRRYNELLETLRRRSTVEILLPTTRTADTTLSVTE
jgi:hypothetical protein